MILLYIPEDHNYTRVLAEGAEHRGRLPIQSIHGWRQLAAETPSVNSDR